MWPQSPLAAAHKSARILLINFFVCDTIIYTKSILDTIEEKISETSENAIPQFLDDGRLIVHIPSRFLFLHPQNNQKTEEEISLPVKVISVIEQISSRPEYSYATRISIPNQKLILVHKGIDNFFNKNPFE